MTMRTAPLGRRRQVLRGGLALAGLALLSGCRSLPFLPPRVPRIGLLYPGVSVPIVLVIGGDPSGIGLVKSIAHPGGITTGLSGIAPRLAGKRLELLKEAVPGLTSVATLWDQSMLSEMGETKVAADRLEIRSQSVEVRQPTTFDFVVNLKTAQAIGLTVPPSVLQQATEVIP